MSRDLLGGHPAWRYRIHVLTVLLGARLPRIPVCLLAWTLGTAAWWLDAPGRRNVSVNLTSLLGRMGRFDQELLALGAYRSFCLMLVDTCRLRRGPAAVPHGNQVLIVDPWDKLATGPLHGPLVVATVHANWELMVAVLHRLGVCPGLCSAVLSTGDPRLDAFQADLRARHGHRGVPLPRAGLALHRWLAAGGIVGLATDRDYGGNGPRLRFGAGWRRLPRGVVVLARRHAAPILPVVLLKRGNRRYILFVGKELRCRPEDPEGPVLRRLSVVLSGLLRLSPRQWAVFHRDQSTCDNKGYDAGATPVPVPAAGARGLGSPLRPAAYGAGPDRTDSLTSNERRQR